MSSRILGGLLALSLLFPAAGAAQSGTILYARSVTRDLSQAAAMLRGPGGDAPARARADGAGRPGGDGAPRARPDNLPVIQGYSDLTVTFDGTAVLTRIVEVEGQRPGQGTFAEGARRRLGAPAGGGDGAGPVGDGALAQRIAQAIPRREDHAIWVDPMSGRVVRGAKFLNRQFRIEEEAPAYRWRLLGEESEFLGYVVQKAEAQHEGATIEAWFTVEIPGFVAPETYTGLPGVVLMVSVNRGETLIQAVSVDLETPVGAIAAPSEGDSMTAEAFEALVEERTEEFRQQMQARLRGRGGDR